jgi:hypothetical protein
MSYGIKIKAPQKWNLIWFVYSLDIMLQLLITSSGTEADGFLTFQACCLSNEHAGCSESLVPSTPSAAASGLRSIIYIFMLLVT